MPKMKDHFLTLLDTYRVMIAKVTMIKKKHNIFTKHGDKCV